MTSDPCVFSTLTPSLIFVRRLISSCLDWWSGRSGSLTSLSSPWMTRSSSYVQVPVLTTARDSNLRHWSRSADLCVHVRAYVSEIVTLSLCVCVCQVGTSCWLRLSLIALLWWMMGCYWRLVCTCTETGNTPALNSSLSHLLVWEIYYTSSQHSIIGVRDNAHVVLKNILVTMFCQMNRDGTWRNVLRL